MRFVGVHYAITPGQRDALKDKAWMQEMFAKHSPDDGQDVIDVTWDWYETVRGFFARAAKNGRELMFTADQ